MKQLVMLLLALTTASAVHATDRFFPDIHERSPSGQFRVDAMSPDNEGEGYRPFQARFIYKCTDVSTGKTLWTREQPMERPVQSDNLPGIGWAMPKEPSPVAIYVSDLGTTAIRTAWDDLIFVSRQGRDVGEIDLLEEALTDAENERFVHNTTAGPMWTGLSVWYFLETPEGEFFVIRPWWGRRIVMNAERAELVRPDEAMLEAAAALEKKLVLAALTSEDGADLREMSKYEAAYLAGVLNLRDAVPSLKVLEKSTYIGSSMIGGSLLGEDYENEVDPYRYSTFGLRQVAQLSLRRLGVQPKSLPSYSFKIERNGKRRPFVIPARKRPRHEAVEEVAVGMSAKQVLTLIGAPDFISHGTWRYDMDADAPFSFTLTFDDRKVTESKWKAPLWKSVLPGDEALAH